MHSLTKEEIRKNFLEKRDSVEDTLRWEWSRSIIASVLDWVKQKAFSRVMVYASFRSEVETGALISGLLASGCRVFLPVCKKDGVMEAYEIHSVSDLKPGAFGILEPAETIAVPPWLLELVLVPGCVFGRNMHRIGYGGGYYDRYLVRCPKALKAGVCYDLSLVDRVEPGEFDVAMDCIFTEKGMIMPNI